MTTCSNWSPGYLNPWLSHLMWEMVLFLFIFFSSSSQFGFIYNRVFQKHQIVERNRLRSVRLLRKGRVHGSGWLGVIVYSGREAMAARARGTGCSGAERWTLLPSSHSPFSSVQDWLCPHRHYSPHSLLPAPRRVSIVILESGKLNLSLKCFAHFFLAINLFLSNQYKLGTAQSHRQETFTACDTS